MLQFKTLYSSWFSQDKWSPFFKRIILLIVLLGAGICQSFGTHLRAGQITVVWKGPRTVEITIQVWTNTLNTTVLFGGDQDVLDFGDGSTMLVQPEVENSNIGPNGPLPPNVAYASFTVRHEYGAPGFYTISYREPNRNEGVLNMDASVNTTFYLETRIIIDPALGNNNSPVLAIDPIDRACPGVAFFHNPGAFDPDVEDSISYEMAIPYSNRNTQVINYRDPNDPSFYTNYETANEAGTGRPTFSINSATGDLTWDSPGTTGEYNIAFHVVEHRKINGVWKRIGYVRRDMQILVEDCDNERPTLKLPPDTCVVAGTLLEVDIEGNDPDGDKVKIEAFSQIFNPPFNPAATISPDPGPEDFVDVPAITNFSWQTDCDHVREQPYSIVFKITDKPPLGPKLATFQTWFVTVVGPKPVWNTATKQDATRSVDLSWDPYECGNAVSMQIWRKVDGSDFQPSNCETGMPAYLGYELIDTVPLQDKGAPVTTFTDKGLEIGPRYCYRLVAIFPAGTRAESLVSDDICVDPLLLVAPVITNVDVDITSNTNGKIIVKWVEPKENPTFPPTEAFSYQIFRGTGFNGAPAPTPIATTTDLFYEDNNLDTEGTIYNYTIVAYSSSGDSVGASGQASSVRLETESRNKRIDLSWSADVPWSNSIAGLTHKIYRGNEGADTKDDLTFLTEVNVNSGGFVYVDEGPLEERLYCYMVETYGSYGNPTIHTDPLINRSQIICAEPGDDIPPCKPLPPALETPRDCAAISDLSDCSGANSYENHLAWQKDDSDCGKDIAFYVIYAANSQNGEYFAIDSVRNSYEFIDRGLDGEGLDSYARCYKISAVDRSGNESEKSDAFCTDNCPYYELPNVFTPNDDGCNDLLTAYNAEQISKGECTLPAESAMKCARFVESVIFNVYNRWGTQVFSYSSLDVPSEDTVTPDGRTLNPILINWDGKSDDGQELSTGVYYYVAEVTFQTIGPENRNKTIKGWVNLIREAGQ